MSNERGMVDVVLCPGVQTGTCVYLKDGQVVYGGPLSSCPPADGLTVLLSAEDFAKIKVRWDRERY